MKKSILIISVVLFSAFILSSCGNSSTKQKPATEKEVANMQYNCPMHPEVVNDKPGNCPKCGMTLVKKEIAIPDSTRVQHSMEGMHN
jgi:hypothetical protein